MPYHLLRLAMSKIDRLQTIDPPNETEQARPDLYVAHTRADPLPMPVASSTANENDTTERGTQNPRWPMILIGFGFCLTLLWIALLVWGAAKWEHRARIQPRSSFRSLKRYASSRRRSLCRMYTRQ
jgi:hypothetical protein